MRIHRRKREEVEVDASSLNDIMFFLMLFFLIASTLANPNVFPVKLPSTGNPPSHIVPETVPITVIRDGDNLHIYIEKDEVDYEELKKRLTELKAKFDDPKNPQAGLSVVLRMDKNANVQDLVDVLQVGANLGVKMVLATDKQSGN